MWIKLLILSEVSLIFKILSVRFDGGMFVSKVVIFAGISKLSRSCVFVVDGESNINSLPLFGFSLLKLEIVLISPTIEFSNAADVSIIFSCADVI